MVLTADHGVMPLVERLQARGLPARRGAKGGTGHGTPHDYDRHVPIVFLGPNVGAGRREAACGPEDIAWALGRLLGLDYLQQDAETDLLPLLR